MLPAGISLLLLIPVMLGCRAIRADVGLGFGLGAIVKVPVVLHTGLGGGFSYTAGHFYEEGWHFGSILQDGFAEGEAAALIVHCTYSTKGPEDEGSKTRRRLTRDSHPCLGVLPGLLSRTGQRGQALNFEEAENYALEFGAYLVCFSVNFGFNPWYLSEHPGAIREWRDKPGLDARRSLRSVRVVMRNSNHLGMTLTTVTTAAVVVPPVVALMILMVPMMTVAHTSPVM